MRLGMDERSYHEQAGGNLGVANGIDQECGVVSFDTITERSVVQPGNGQWSHVQGGVDAALAAKHKDLPGFSPTRRPPNFTCVDA